MIIGNLSMIIISLIPINQDNKVNTLIKNTSGMFERMTLSFGPVTIRSKVALTAGSSQHGNARLASVDSNWVDAANL